MGESTQEKKAKQIYNQTDSAINDFKNVDLSLGDYRTYNPQEMMSGLNDVFNIGTNNINKTFQNDINRTERNVGERLASQGVKGSLANNAIVGSGDSARSARYGAIGDLTANQAGAKVGLMGDINQMDQGDAQFNALAKLRKYNAILEGINSKLGSTQLMDNTNTWDDIFAGLETGGNIAKSVAAFM